ncbi:TPA_exp: Uncharacterized protein A8136_3256 [Trichophyton benhamiae CBS 112371]|uniref:C2H2-type domain-containing protein n=1 Tax=Arthroderma benhamiae (strain ATCC MYA-4681 / CBS 112371) TaxID=663331 RepID=D4AZV2_ARTBC|nr:uncharacterized protein ARB_01722 [Trichophyton benhamiae CBS 112371]EFE31327.1 hypothetical protein ARB_01722 [Trichophyton benhamiae CBS 112371]DAA74498.1 TPA_exp: Uncharacterized protein A8136_3256 [Trichophyton benhamiae CBS 112371]
MAYNGYGYPQYQHTNSRAQQSQTPYAPPSQTPKPAAPAPENRSQDYGQQNNSWNGQNVSRQQTSSQQNVRNSYWLSPANNTASQPITYQQQVSYRMSGTNQTTTAHQYNNQAHSLGGTNTHVIDNYGGESNPNMGVRRDMVNSGARYTSSPLQGQAAAIPPVTTSQNPQSYQSTTPSHQSDYMQNPRTVAATAMTALSTAARRNYTQNAPAASANSYQVSNSARYNASAGDPTGHSPATNTSSSSNTYQYQTTNPGQVIEAGTATSNSLNQTSNTSDMSTHSVTSSAEPSPQLQHRVHQTKPATSRSPTLFQHPNRTSSSSQIRRPGQEFSMNTAKPDNGRASPAMSQRPYSQPTDTSSVTAESPTQNSLPRFVDPTNIYNPYYGQFGTSGVTNTAHASVEPDVTSVTGGIEGIQVETQQNSTQPPAQNATPSEVAPNTTVSNVATNALEASITKEASKGTPQGVSNDAPKKARKRPNRKQKPGTASAPISPSTQPQTTSTTQEEANGKEDTATQMQRMLDEMRKKDPDLFKSILAANMGKQESSGQTAPQVPSKVDNTSAKTYIEESSIASSSQLPPPHSSNNLPKKKARNKRATGDAVFLISTPAQKGASPSIINNNNMSTENTQAEQHHETALPSTRPSQTQNIKTIIPEQVAKPGFIDGLPDLGKFPALRRKRRLKASLTANESSPAPNSNLGLENEISAAHLSGQPVPAPEAPTSVPQPYASLSVEEQRLSLLDNFTKTGHAEFPQSPNIPPSSTEDIQLTQEGHPRTTLDAPLPLQGQSQPAGDEVGKEERMTSFWPDQKRRLLAESACQYISTFPGNDSITSDFISSLIEQNPSYVQLCNMLEGHGYTINKVHFAKHLLKTFPDLGESSNKETKATSEPAMQTSQPSLPDSSFVSSTPADPIQIAIPQQNLEVTALQPGSVPSKSVSALPLSREKQRQKSLNLLHISKRRRKSAPQHRSSISASPAPQPREPFPNSKEAMARKRTFAEIVDLSQAISDEDESEAEDEVLDQPNLLEIAVEDTMNTSLDVTMEDAINVTPVQRNTPEILPQCPSEDRKVVPSVQKQLVRSREPSPAVQPMPEKPTSMAKPKHVDATPQPTGKEDLRRYNGIVKPMNKAKALKRSYYDPRTIARDILIAAGRHPTERSLNYHLLKLKENFQFVDYTSDLETFRWDLVDPGGPPPPKIAPEPLLSQPKSHSRDDFISRDETSAGRRFQSERGPSQLRISHTVNTDSSSTPPRPMAPTPQKPTFASSLPTRRRPGRPPGAKNKPKAIPSVASKVEVAVPRATPQYPSNKYPIYECGFDGCGAKLHNFEIFRKHVLKLHSQSGKEQAICRWTGCASGEAAPRIFSTEGLKQHLDSVHLSPLAWKLGDGPKSVSSGETGKFHLPIVIS